MAGRDILEEADERRIIADIISENRHGLHRLAEERPSAEARHHEPLHRIERFLKRLLSDEPAVGTVDL